MRLSDGVLWKLQTVKIFKKTDLYALRNNFMLFNNRELKQHEKDFQITFKSKTQTRKLFKHPAESEGLSATC